MLSEIRCCVGGMRWLRCSPTQRLLELCLLDLGLCECSLWKEGQVWLWPWGQKVFVLCRGFPPNWQQPPLCMKSVVGLSWPGELAWY